MYDIRKKQKMNNLAPTETIPAQWQKIDAGIIFSWPTEISWKRRVASPTVTFPQSVNKKKGAKKRFCYIDWLILTAQKHTLVYSREMLIHSLKILS